MKVNLKTLKELVEMNTPVKPMIKDIWIDYGAGWHDWTLVAPETKDKMSYQMLNPGEVNKINNGTFTIEDAKNLIDKINNRGW